MMYTGGSPPALRQAASAISHSAGVALRDQLIAESRGSSAQDIEQSRWILRKPAAT